MQGRTLHIRSPSFDPEAHEVRVHGECVGFKCIEIGDRNGVLECALTDIFGFIGDNSFAALEADAVVKQPISGGSQFPNAPKCFFQSGGQLLPPHGVEALHGPGCIPDSGAGVDHLGSAIRDVGHDAQNLVHCRFNFGIAVHELAKCIPVGGKGMVRNFHD